MSLDALIRRLRLRDLRTLASVARGGSMRKAAQDLHLSLPAVSRSIADLEATVGLPLLVRTTSGAVPTAYGEALVRRSRVLFDELEAGMRELAQLADPGTGDVRLGCMETLHAGLVGACVEQLVQLHPRMKITLELGQAPDLVQYHLSQRIVDFVVARPLKLPLPAGMHGEALFHDRLLVVTGEDSRWARQQRITLADLADAYWIVGANEMEPGSPLVEAFERARVAMPSRVIRTGSLHTRYRLLQAGGDFVTLMPDSLLAFTARRTDVRVLPVELPVWLSPTMIITIKGRSLPPAADLFIDTLRRMAKSFKSPAGKGRRQPAKGRP